MSYGIQVDWPDGHWLWVMDETGDGRAEYESRAEAEQVAGIWRKPGYEDAVRVVELRKDDEVAVHHADRERSARAAGLELS